MKNLTKKQRNILIICTIVTILIRLIFINGKSGDYLTYLKPWITDIKRLGYLKSLKYNIGDYNVPYMVILTLITLVKFKSLYLIKLVSIIFDFVCAIFGYKIVYKITKDIDVSILTYVITLFLPTVIINGSLWAQCDSIFSAFTLISLYYLLDKKYTLSFIFLGVSFAFKLQCIFILPLYGIMFFKEKKIHIYHFLIIPLVNFIMCLPAILMGRNIMSVMMIYLNQTKEYDWLSMNFPNIYNHFDDYHGYINSPLIAKIGIVVTFLILLSMLIYILIKKVNMNSEKILLVGLWSIVIATYFLPYMHERYMYVAELLSVIYFMSYFKNFYIPIVINLVSSIAYFYVLFDITIISLNNLAILYLVFIIIFSIYTYKTVGRNNEVNKE